MPTGRPDYTSSTVMRGIDPSDYLIPVAVDDSGNLITLVQGSDGGTLHTVAVDSNGRIVMVPAGVLTVDGTITNTPTTTTTQAQGSDGSGYRYLKVDSNGQLIMVPRGQSGYYMNVDSAGNMAALMKGVHSGTPVTIAADAAGNLLGLLQGYYNSSPVPIAVDASGRMLAVMTDPADVFGNPMFMGGAELATRIGAPITWERRGETLFMDSFQDGLSKWEVATVGAASIAVPSTYTGYSDGFCAKLTTDTHDNDYVLLRRRVAYPALSNFGISAASHLPNINCRFDLVADMYTGVAHYTYGLRYDQLQGYLSYYDATGAYVSFATGISLATDSLCMHRFKVVFDPVNHKYLRAVVNNTTYDLSAHNPYMVGSVTAAQVAVVVGLRTWSPTANNAYVDDIILSQNEPAA